MQCLRAISIFFLLLPLTFAAGSQDVSPWSNSFPLQKQIIRLTDQLTSRQYREARQAVRREVRHPRTRMLTEPEAILRGLDVMRAAKVSLGSLGEGLMVEFTADVCGTGGCPMWLLVPQEGGGYRVALQAFGWGFTLRPRASGVPDVLFFARMGAANTEVGHYRYVSGSFRPVRGAESGSGRENCNLENSDSNPDCRLIDVRVIADYVPKKEQSRTIHKSPAP